MKKRRSARSSDSLLDQKPFRRIYETNIIGLSLSGLDGRFLYCNDETLRIIGYDRHDLEAGAINWKVLTPLEHLPKDLAAVREMQAVGHCAPFEKEYIRKDGNRVPVLVAFSLVKEGLAFGTIADLTTQRELLRRRSSGDSSLGLAVIDAVHKMNNQLAVILMNAELALSVAGANEQLKAHLTEVIQFAKRGKEVNDALADQAKASKPTKKTWSKRSRVYKCKTRLGVFTIAPDLSYPRRWALSLGVRILGSYATPVLAADAVVNRRTGFAAWDALEHSRAPGDLSRWEPV
jgi:PAS domain S-box-containing protein